MEADEAKAAADKQLTTFFKKRREEKEVAPTHRHSHWLEFMIHSFHPDNHACHSQASMHVERMSRNLFVLRGVVGPTTWKGIHLTSSFSFEQTTCFTGWPLAWACA